MGSGNETTSGFVVGLGDCPSSSHLFSFYAIRIADHIKSAIVTPEVCVT